jgi:hypothetical protein
MKHGSDGKVYQAKIEWVEVEQFTTSEPSIVEHVGMIEKSSLEIAIQNASEPVPVDSLAGKLKATEKHLEDMRKIAFEITTENIREVTK